MTAMTIDTEATASNPPRVSPKSPPSKVPVAKSDFEHALQAIDKVMALEISSSSNGDDNDDNNNNNNDMDIDNDNDEKLNETSGSSTHDEENEEPCSKKVDPKEVFLTQVHNSLKERLYQIVQPIPDEDFHKRVRGPVIQLQIDEENELEQRLIAQEEANFQRERATIQQMEAMKDGEYNTDYDEQELIDEEALKRARDLRVQVRNLASGMRQQQEAILERAIQLAQREIRLLTEDVLLQEHTNNTPSYELSQETLEAFSVRRKVLKEMETSLKQLTKSLYKTVDGVLPKNLQDLKDTIAAIEKSLQKKDQPQSLSQTEKAIVSRSNEGACSNDSLEGSDCAVLVEEPEDFVDTEAPEFILADFLGKF